VFVFHAGWFHETKQVGENEALSMNMYISQPQPLFYLQEFQPVLDQQMNQFGALATPHCASGWQALLATGFHRGGGEEKFKEASWRAMDAAEAGVAALGHLLSWAPESTSPTCPNPACGCNVN
jgi:hypothetical protein